jgi:DNA-binding CsgD family transcriptional regulator
VELGEQALRLTPADSPERTERLLTLAEYMEVVGDTTGVRALLAPEIERLPPGPARAQAHLLLASDLSNADEVEAHFEKALRESEADPGLRARLLTTRATDVAAGRVERLRQCQEWVEEARTLVHGHGCDGVEHVLEALGWIRLLRGQALDDLVDEAGSLPLEPELYGSVERIAAIQLTCRGQLEEARASFGRLLRLADERGEMWSYFALRLQLCELELRAGRWAEVERLLEEWDESLGATFDPARCRCEALLAAGRGFPDEAEKRATEAITGDRAACVRWSSFEALRARGLTALLAGDLARAAESLTEVWDHCEREGVEEPGVFPVAPELVEVFLELDEPAEASRVTARLGELARAHAHPWGLATERRCSGLIGLRAGDDDAAAAVLAAAAEYDRLGLAFDRARTLLAFGRTARRLRKWGLARNPLEEAAAAFAQIGSSGWADAAHSELARVGARRPAPQGALTPTEQRVASLAADGLSNKEIAAELFVTVNTVEKHLSHAYEKLGLRSRGQLAARLKPSA